MNETTKTEFNSSQATLERIDTILKIASACSSQGNYFAWFEQIDNLSKEVIVKMGEEEEKKFNELFDSVSKNLIGYGKAMNLPQGCPINITLSFRTKLRDAEMFLRRIMDKKGMLLRDSEINLRGI
jgi:hypothetical protein